jgi:hypothetical protein
METHNHNRYKKENSAEKINEFFPFLGNKVINRCLNIIIKLSPNLSINRLGVETIFFGGKRATTFQKPVNLVNCLKQR